MNEVKVAGKTIQCVMQDGVAYVSVRHMCEALGLNSQRQIQKLLEDEDFNCKHMYATGSDGKSYEMVCLSSKQANGWLYTINTNKVKPTTKQFLKLFKAELETVVDDYFNKGSVFNKQAYMDDPYQALKHETEAKLKMLEEIIQMRELAKLQEETIQDQQETIELQLDEGSLNWTKGYYATAAFRDEFLSPEDQVLYDMKGVSKRLGRACTKHCELNSINFETQYVGSHHKEVHGYQLEVLETCWAALRDEIQPEPQQDCDMFQW